MASPAPTCLGDAPLQALPSFTHLQGPGLASGRKILFGNTVSFLRAQDRLASVAIGGYLTSLLSIHCPPCRLACSHSGSLLGSILGRGLAHSDRAVLPGAMQKRTPVPGARGHKPVPYTCFSCRWPCAFNAKAGQPARQPALPARCRHRLQYCGQCGTLGVMRRPSYHWQLRAARHGLGVNSMPTASAGNGGRSLAGGAVPLNCEHGTR